MFLQDNDYLIVREEGFRLYLYTFIFLVYFEWYTLAMIYSYIAASSFASEEDVDEESEELAWEIEMYRAFEHYWSLRPFDEQDDLVLLDWQVEEILEEAIDDPQFPESYNLIDSYRKSFCNNSHLTNYLLPKRIEVDDIVQRTAYTRQKVLKSRLVVSDKFNETFRVAGVMRQPSLVKFKSHALIVNTFLVESLVYKGLYPYTEYDYDMYIFKSHQFNQLFLECLLITEKPLNKINHLIDFKNDTETLVAFIFGEVLPEEYQMENYLKKRTDNIFENPWDDKWL